MFVKNKTRVIVVLCFLDVVIMTEFLNQIRICLTTSLLYLRIESSNEIKDVGT